MPIDLTQIKKKILPPQDGQDDVKLRTATVSAVNSNGTVDLTMNGVSVPGVPRLNGALASVGAVVQVLSYRGSLLVIGTTSSGPGGAVVKTGSTTAGPTAQTSFTVAVNYGVTFPGLPNVHINLNNGAGATANWHARAISITTTGFTLFAFGPSSTFSTSEWRWTAIYAP
jgi:hypothetical protein